MSATITLRTIAKGLGIYADSPAYPGTIEAATAYAMQLGYRATPGAEDAYADLGVSPTDAEIIRDMIANVDPVTGVYTGDRDQVASLAAE